MLVYSVRSFCLSNSCSFRRAGRDAARAFATGCFATHRTHDVRGLTEREQKVCLSHVNRYLRANLVSRAWNTGKTSLQTIRNTSRSGVFFTDLLTLQALFLSHASQRNLLTIKSQRLQKKLKRRLLLVNTRNYKYINYKGRLFNDQVSSTI